MTLIMGSTRWSDVNLDAADTTDRGWCIKSTWNRCS